jgi:hypothetical protein
LTIFQWSSCLMISRPPSWPKWGSSIIPLYTLTRVCHFWVQFLSDDPQAPKILLSRGIHGFFPIILQFITNFQCSSFPMTPKTPRFNPARIIKVVFTILTRLHYFCMKFFTYDPQDPKIQLRWSGRIFSPFSHFSTNLQWSSRLIIPKAPSPNQQWVHKHHFHYFDTFWPFFSVVVI